MYYRVSIIPLIHYFDWYKVSFLVISTFNFLYNKSGYSNKVLK